MKAAVNTSTKCVLINCQRVVPDVQWRKGQRLCRLCREKYQGKLFEPKPLTPATPQKAPRQPKLPTSVAPVVYTPRPPSAAEITDAKLAAQRADDKRASVDAKMTRYLELRKIHPRARALAILESETIAETINQGEPHEA